MGKVIIGILSVGILAAALIATICWSRRAVEDGICDFSGQGRNKYGE